MNSRIGLLYLASLKHLLSNPYLKVIVLPIRFRIIIALCAALILYMIVAMLRDSKPKEIYQSVTGTVSFIDKRFGNLPTRDFGKYRYLQLDNYPYILELFIGKDFGDFKPKFERLDALHAGDQITIYYYNANEAGNDGINRHVKFIDKSGQNYFEAGDALKYVGIFVIFVCVLLGVFCYYLWKKKKIPF